MLSFRIMHNFRPEQGAGPAAGDVRFVHAASMDIAKPFNSFSLAFVQALCTPGTSCQSSLDLAGEIAAGIRQSCCCMGIMGQPCTAIVEKGTWQISEDFSVQCMFSHLVAQVPSAESGILVSQHFQSAGGHLERLHMAHSNMVVGWSQLWYPMRQSVSHRRETPVAS